MISFLVFMKKKTHRIKSMPHGQCTYGLCSGRTCIQQGKNCSRHVIGAALDGLLGVIGDCQKGTAKIMIEMTFM